MVFRELLGGWDNVYKEIRVIVLYRIFVWGKWFWELFRDSFFGKFFKSMMLFILEFFGVWSF